MAVARSRHQCKPPLSIQTTDSSLPAPHSCSPRNTPSWGCSCVPVLLKSTSSPEKGLMKKSAISRSGEIHICPKENVKRNCKSVSQQQQTAIPKVNICLFSKFSGSPTTHFPLKNCTKDFIFSRAKEKGAQKLKKYNGAKRFQWVSLDNWYRIHVLMVERQSPKIDQCSSESRKATCILFISFCSYNPKQEQVL